MKSKDKQFTRRFSFAHRGAAILSILTLLSGTFAAGVGAQRAKSQPSGAKLSEEQRILHVLNRLGYGARPGDVERVKAMGIEKYIQQQLEPGRIDDAVAVAKVENLETLRMTTAQLYEKYPQPGQLLRQLQRRGDLPADLAEARENRTKGGANAAPDAAGPQKNGGAMDGEMSGNDVAKGNDAKANVPANPNIDAANPLNNEAYRKVVRDYYAKNNLKPPQFLTGELHASRILRAVYSERQLQEVLVDFWSNHFNVFAGKGADRWLLPAYDRDTIRPHTMGKFHDLLLATAQSPAMLFYLDNFQSVSPKAQPGPRAGQRPGAQRGPLAGLMRGNAENRQPPFTMSNNPQQQRPQLQRPQGINENYARELMELHTLGVDGGYTQKDVQEVARCFTGWTIFAPRGGAAAVQAMANTRRAEMLRENAGKFYFALDKHDDGEKIVLGQKIPAGGGIKDGLMVLDILAHHPATAQLIATKLARRFVTDNPSPALVDRVAAAFTKSDGDIRETLKAIFFSSEFNSPEAYRAKIKRPFELAISAVRTLGGETNGGPAFHQWIARMGQPLYGFQTPNGYADVAESWVNTGALLERLNFGLSLASNRIPGTRVDLARFVGETADSKSVDKERVMERFLNIIVQGDISPKTKDALLKQVDQQIALPPPAPAASAGAMIGPGAVPNVIDALMQTPDAAQQPRRQQQLARSNSAQINNPVVKIVGLILGSPEFQRQ